MNRLPREHEYHIWGTWLRLPSLPPPTPALRGTTNAQPSHSRSTSHALQSYQHQQLSHLSLTLQEHHPGLALLSPPPSLMPRPQKHYQLLATTHTSHSNSTTYASPGQLHTATPDARLPLLSSHTSGNPTRTLGSAGEANENCFLSMF